VVDRRGAGGFAKVWHRGVAERVGTDEDFVVVADLIAIAVGLVRVGAEDEFHIVGHAVVIGVGVRATNGRAIEIKWVGSRANLHAIGDAVGVAVGVVGVGSKNVFRHVGNAVAVAVEVRDGIDGLARAVTRVIRVVNI